MGFRNLIEKVFPIARKRHPSYEGMATGQLNGELFNQIDHMSIPRNRYDRYKMFQKMDSDEIEFALDIISDSVTNTDEMGNIINFELDDTATDYNSDIIHDEWENFKSILELDNNIWTIVRDTCKFGESFYELSFDNTNLEDNQGYLGIQELSRETMSIVLNQENKICGYDQEISIEQSDNNNMVLRNPKHAKLKATTSYGRYNNIGEIKYLEDGDAPTFSTEQIIHFKIDGYFYGKSILERVIKTWMALRRMEDSMVIYRIIRAPERRIFYIPTGRLPAAQADEYIEKVKQEYGKRKLLKTMGTNHFEAVLELDIKSAQEDYFIPIRCITLDTKIPLLDGRTLPLQEIISEFEDGKENWVYSVNQQTGQFIKGQIEWAGITRKNAELVKVTLDNDKSIITTPDHKFVLRDGTECEAKDLIKNQSLMPLYRKTNKWNKNKNGYELILNNSTGKYEFTHLNVCPKTTDNTVIHHKNLNSKDNSPFNLIEMDINEHSELHKSLGSYHLTNAWNDPEKRENLLNGIKNYWNNLTDEEFSRRKKIAVENLSSTWDEISSKHYKLAVAKHKELLNDPEYRRKWIENCKKAQNRPENKAIARRTSIQNNKRGKTYFANDVLFTKFRHIVMNNNFPTYKTLKYMLKNDPDFMEEFWRINLNLQEYLKDRIKQNGFGGKFIDKVCKYGNYSSYGELKNSYNHKVKSVEILNYKEDTGCITVKDAGINHNFATDAGVYIKNSDGASAKVETLPGGCLALDTEIKLLDGRTETLNTLIDEFKAGKENWVYSCDPDTGKVTGGLISWAGITQRNAKVLKLTFDNGETITVTPDHKFPVWGKGKVEARDLEIGSSIIPLYTKNTKMYKNVDYEQVFNHETERWEYTHRLMATDFDLNESINNSQFINEFLQLNNKVHSNSKGFVENTLKKMIKFFGYDNWTAFKNQHQYHNHKVVNIEYLDKRIDVGTLTIDQEEIHNNYHTFALACGVFTYNSHLNEIDDVLYWKEKLFSALKVPPSYLSGETLYNDGKVGIALQREIKFAKYIERIQKQFCALIRDKFEDHLLLKGYDTEQISFAIFMPPPSSYKQTSMAEVHSVLLNNYTSSISNEFISKVHAMKKYLLWNDDEIRENLKMLVREQNAIKVDPNDPEGTTKLDLSILFPDEETKKKIKICFTKGKPKIDSLITKYINDMDDNSFENNQEILSSKSANKKL